MTQNDDLKKKLESLGERIQEKKNELSAKGIFRREHQISQAELDARYQQLRKELDEDVHELESARRHVSNFEKAILKWFNAIDLDSR